MRSILTNPYVRFVMAIAALGSLAYLARQVVVPYAIEPIGWLLWAGWRLLASINQAVCWGLVIIICAAEVVQMLSIYARGNEGPASEQAIHAGDAGRLAHWQRLAKDAMQSREGRSTFQISLNAVMAAVTEGMQQVPPRELQANHQNRRRALLDRLLPGRLRRAELGAMEKQLAWMESLLEINDAR